MHGTTKTLITILALGALVGGCAGDADYLDGEDDGFAIGKADGAIEEGSAEARAVLAVVNDATVNFEILDDDAGLNSRAARNIIDHRNGPDGLAASDDDDLFDTLAELDEVKYVGPYALDQLLAYAVDYGYLEAEQGKSIDVIFSPQPYGSSHSDRVAQLIDSAQHSIDIAMYSYSDSHIADALAAAVARGVEVRFVFETANEDRKLTGSALENSASGRLERMGINVRYINKIMHHKFMIVDGPRDDVSAADTATVVTGSANWSYSAATRYDENTLFFRGQRELTLRLQREFNLMWEHSRDVVVDASLPYDLSSYVIEPASIPDELSNHAFFTSNNFTVNDTTFRVTGKNTVSDALVAAIEGATESIWIASGHLRSRPVAEALMAKAAAHPEMDIRVYLDDQEYISSYYNDTQLAELDDCLAAATTESQQRNCYDKGFHFGYTVGQSGVQVRYKYYSYRWHYTYAVQMHHKYMIIDGEQLWTGSYNLSDNAEHNTFENMLMFRGPDFAGLIAAYTANFDTIWQTGRADGLLAGLIDQIEDQSQPSFPIVFEPMALTWDEVTDLKERIRDNCADINSDSYRNEPEKHYSCYR